MTMQSTPDGYSTVSPYLLVEDVAALIDFLQQSFEAEEIRRMRRPDGSIQHAEVRIGDSVVMMGESTDEFAPMPAMLHVYVDAVDAVYERALDAGALSIEKPADKPDGDRRGGVQDAWGNQWWMATSPEVAARRDR